MREFIGSPFEQDFENDEDDDEIEFTETIIETQIFGIFGPPPDEDEEEEEEVENNSEDDPDFDPHDIDDDSESSQDFVEFIEFDSDDYEDDDNQERRFVVRRFNIPPQFSSDEDSDGLDYVTFPIANDQSEIADDKPTSEPTLSGHMVKYLAEVIIRTRNFLIQELVHRVLLTLGNII